MSQIQQENITDLRPLDEKAWPVPGGLVKHVDEEDSVGVVITIVRGEATVLWASHPLSTVDRLQNQVNASLKRGLREKISALIASDDAEDDNDRMHAEIHRALVPLQQQGLIAMYSSSSDYDPLTKTVNITVQYMMTAFPTGFVTNVTVTL